MLSKKRSLCKIALIHSLAFSSAALGETRVAVIDSGYNPVANVKLCPDGHYDFIAKQPVVGKDVFNHGTEVVRVISKYSTQDVCFLIYKVFTDNKALSPEDSAKAFDKAIEAGASVINFSIDSGSGFNYEEYMAVWYASQKARIFVSAGNRSFNMDNRRLFPAGYQLIDWTVVGSKHKMSNKGSFVKRFEPICDGKFCGTSASCAIATGKYLGGG